jgi:hypothetical protein
MPDSSALQTLGADHVVVPEIQRRRLRPSAARVRRPVLPGDPHLPHVASPVVGCTSILTVEDRAAAARGLHRQHPLAIPAGGDLGIPASR